MKSIRVEDSVEWIESRLVTSKIVSYCKFKKFLEWKYALEIEYGKVQCFSGKNNFQFNSCLNNKLKENEEYTDTLEDEVNGLSRINSALGYCVEYYSKYLVYGEDYLKSPKNFIEEAKKEFGRIANSNYSIIIVRACILKYKKLMELSFGRGTGQIIKTISVETLIKEYMSDFVNKVVELGTKTANYVNNVLYSNTYNKKPGNPILSIKHITGLADYITKDTILDVKVLNHIGEKEIKQVLGYHYLSTKRADLNITRVIIYDATSGRSVIIPINPSREDWSKLYAQSAKEFRQIISSIESNKS